MAKSLGQQLGRTLRTAEGKADSRAKLIRAVHLACRRKGLTDDEDRRAVQLAVTGEASLAKMTLPQIGQLLTHLNKDWKGPSPDRAHLGKIKALWWTLYWLGAVEDPKESALDAFVKRQAKVDRLRWLDHRKASSVIEALKDWAAREDVRWPGRAKVEEAKTWAQPVSAATLDRFAVLDELARRLQRRRALFGSWVDYLRVALNQKNNHHHWSDRDLDEGIRILGKMERRALEAERAAE